MRIKITFEGGGKKLPSHNQHMVNGFIHSCLGDNNEYHDSKNTYAVSMLNGGKLYKHGIFSYDYKANIIVSGDAIFLSKIVDGVMKLGNFNGMKLLNIEFIQEELFNGINHFATLSPILLKRDNKRFATLNDDDYQNLLESQIKSKVRSILPDEDTSNIHVFVNKNGSKTKLVKLRDVKNIGNVHHLSIECNKKVAELLYRVGIGQSTGAGFGTIYKTGNKSIYFDEK